MAALTATTVVLTGANGGLGLAVLRSLCESTQRYHIFAACRTAEKAATAIATTTAAVPSTTSTLEPLVLDGDSDTSIAAAVQTVQAKTPHLHILINNAGTMYDPAGHAGTLSKRDVFNRSWATNVTGTYLVTEAFVPLLIAAKGARLLFVTSGTASMGEAKRTDHPIFQRIGAIPAAGWPKDSTGLGSPAYRSSKAGLNMVMVEWARVLREDGVKAFSISPGFLATGFAGLPVERARKAGAQDPSVGGNLIRDVVQGEWDEHEGEVVRQWPFKGVQTW